MQEIFLLIKIADGGGTTKHKNKTFNNFVHRKLKVLNDRNTIYEYSFN
jgi:hypothetical protein